MKIRGLHILVVSLVAVNCTGELPISDLINNTITLKVLGTYESNDPYGDLGLKKDDIIDGGAGILGASPTLGLTTDIYDYASSQILNETIKYYIDIAEIRIAQGQGQSSNDTVSSYWSQFAIERQLMCTDYSSAENRTLSNCAAQNGTNRLSEFFSGGFTYPAVDISTGTYNHLGIYFRRFNISPAAQFYGDGKYYNGAPYNTSGTKTTASQSVTSAFDNRTIFAVDIESFLQNKYGETATEPGLFPLQRKDLSLTIQGDQEPYVMEVRIFLKNLMMVHARQVTGDVSNPTNLANAASVYIGPADWNVDHAYKDLANAGRMGGSVLMTARTYQPAKVGAIQMASTIASPGYFAVVLTGTTFATPVTTLPLAATAGTNGRIANLSPGTYDIYRTCDKQYCSTASTAGTCDNFAGANLDGYPETAVYCSTATVTTGTTTTGLLTGCGAC
jgi:hypothetical protein